MTAGDTYELVTGDTSAGEALTLTIEAELEQRKYDEVVDKVVGMYVIDGKKFDEFDLSREKEYTEMTAADLPDPASPQSVREWLDKLRNHSAGFENIFYKYFDAETITQRGDNSTLADFSGEIMVYDLPVGPFKPVFIAVTEKGAYNVYMPAVAEDKQLVGLRKSGMLDYFTTMADLHSKAENALTPLYVIPFMQISPTLSEATGAMDFSASVDEDNGYLEYEYSQGVTIDAGTMNPGGSSGSATSYLPSMLGIEAGGSVGTSVSGRDRSIKNLFKGFASKEVDTEKFIPSFISDVATTEVKATGTLGFDYAYNYGTDAKLKTQSSEVSLTGELETETNISAMGAAGKLIGGGVLAPVFKAVKNLA